MMISNTGKIAGKTILVSGAGRTFMSKAMTVQAGRKLSAGIVGLQHGNQSTDNPISLRKFGDVDAKKYNALHYSNIGVIPSYNVAARMLHTSAWNCDKSKAEESPIAGLFSSISKSLSPELVEKTKAIYQFNVKGKEEGVWHLDLKNGSGACGQGEPPSAADATLTMDSKNFVDMFSGKLKPATAFMMGKLKISGDMQKAMKLEKLMASLKAKA